MKRPEGRGARVYRLHIGLPLTQGPITVFSAEAQPVIQGEPSIFPLLAVHVDRVNFMKCERREDNSTIVFGFDSSILLILPENQRTATELFRHDVDIVDKRNQAISDVVPSCILMPLIEFIIPVPRNYGFLPRAVVNNIEDVVSLVP